MEPAGHNRRIGGNHGDILTFPRNRVSTRDLCGLYAIACRSGSFDDLEEELRRRVFEAVQPGEILTSLAYCGVLTCMAWDLARLCHERKYSPVYFSDLFEHLLAEYA